MNKIDLILALKDTNHLSRSEAETVITLFFDKMADALAKGDRVEIRGLCSFFIKKYGRIYRAESQNRRVCEGCTEKIAFFQGGQGIEGSCGPVKAKNGICNYDGMGIISINHNSLILYDNYRT